MRNFQDDLAAYVGDSTCMPPFHPDTKHFPPDLQSPDFTRLVDSIEKLGLQVPMTMHNGELLSGCRRIHACRAARVQLKPKDFVEFDDSKMTTLEFVFIENLHRRQLSPGQRSMCADDMVTSKNGGNHKDEFSRPAAAKLWGVSLWSVEGADIIKRYAIPKVIARVRAGTMTIARARHLAEMEREEQRAEPDVKFGGPRRSKSPTVKIARAWLDLDTTDKLHFVGRYVDPWFREQRNKTPEDH
jgi:hypothetical protein